MLNITQETINKFIDEGNLKQYIIKVGEQSYGSSNLVGDSIDIKESLCSEEIFNFNRVEKSSISVSFINFGQAIKNTEGKTLEITQVVNGEEIKLGKYILNKPEIKNDNLAVLTGYDFLIKFDIDVSDWWNNKVVFPITHRNLLISLCNYCGVQHNISSTYVNSGFLINRNIQVESTFGREFLGYLQEVSACFYKVDRVGILKPIDVIKTTPDFTYSARDVIKPSFADYIVEKVEKLQIRGSTDDVGVVVGIGTNTYVIQSNPLLYGMVDSQLRPIATNIFNKIKDLTYIPFNCNMKGYPFIEVGDLIKIDTLKNSYTTVLLSRALKGTGFQKDKLESKGKVKREGNKNINQTIKILNQKMSETVDTVEKYQKTLTDVAEGLQSQITQQAGEINIQSQQLKYKNLLVNSDFKIGLDTNWDFGGSYIPPTNWKHYNDNKVMYAYVYDNNFTSGRAMQFFKYKDSESSTYQEFEYKGKSKVFFMSCDIKLMKLTNREKILPILYYKLKGSSVFKYIYPDQSTISNNVDILNKVVREEYRYDLKFEKEDIVALAPRLPGSNESGSSDIYFRIDRVFFTDGFPYPDKNLWNDLASNNLLSSINLSPEGIKINADKLDITGFVTFNDLSNSGSTIINGDNIKTGTLSAISIENLQRINGVNINATGDITALNWDGRLVHLTYNNGIVTGWWLENVRESYVSVRNGAGTGSLQLVFHNGLYMGLG